MKNIAITPTRIIAGGTFGSFAVAERFQYDITAIAADGSALEGIGVASIHEVSVLFGDYRMATLKTPANTLHVDTEGNYNWPGHRRSPYDTITADNLVECLKELAKAHAIALIDNATRI